MSPLPVVAALREVDSVPWRPPFRTIPTTLPPQAEKWSPSAWNGWPPSNGITGRLPTEWVVALDRNTHWTAQQLLDYRQVFASWPKILRREIAGLGEVLFCHGTPRSETEGFTRLTPEERLIPLFAELGVSVVVCGHTHMQFDRRIGATRVVNAGSVGMPFGDPGAFWVLLGPGVQLRQTRYDLVAAAERIRATPYPQAQAEAQSLLQPPSEAAMLELFSR
jgi:calcineurin-like phosphoesterase family protein